VLRNQGFNFFSVILFQKPPLFSSHEKIGLINDTFYVLEIMELETINEDQCAFILQVFNDTPHSSIAILCSNFVVFALKNGLLEPVLKFLHRITILSNQSTQDKQLLQKLDWSMIVQQLFCLIASTDDDSKFSIELVTLLTNISKRGLANMEKHVKENIVIFKSKVISVLILNPV